LSFLLWIARAVFGCWLVVSFEFADWLVSLRRDEVARCRWSILFAFRASLEGE